MDISTRVSIRRINGEWHIHLIENETKLYAYFFIYEPFFNESPDRYDLYYLPYGRSSSLTITAIDGAFSISQAGSLIEADGTLDNIRHSDKHLIITYDPTKDTGNTGKGSISYRPANDDTAPVRTLHLVTRRDFTPESPDDDNIVDRSSILVPEHITTGRGQDTITPGKLDDIIEPGLDDDIIDLSADEGDSDEIIYTVAGNDDYLIAYDGGDMITGFIPGQDVFDFGLPPDDSGFEKISLSNIDQAFGITFVVVPIIEYEQIDSQLSLTDRKDKSFWANYLITGVEVHFSEALVLPSGRLTGTILTILFDPAHTIRGDIFLSKAGDGFDDLFIKFTDMATVEAIVEDEFTNRDASRSDSAKDEVIAHSIHENHPESKPLLVLEIDTAWDAGGTWSLPKTPGILSDEALFEIRAGQLWARGIPDYEDPKDGWGNNLYQFMLRYTEPDGTEHDQWHEIAVRDLGFERPGGVNGLFRNIRAFNFKPTDIPGDDLPSLFVQYLIRGRAWKMPDEGPLTITWSLVTQQDEPQSLLTDANIGLFREDLERAFDQFETAANLLFVEVAHTDSNAGDILLTYGPKLELGGSRYNLGFARFPSDDPIVVIRDITGLETHEPNKPWRFTAMVHEIGHVMGLGHPFADDGETSSWPTPDGNIHRFSDETIMSYRNPSVRTTQGLYQADIDALQFLYGAPGTDFDGVESLITTPIDYI